LVPLRRAVIPIMAVVAVLIGLGLTVQDTVSAASADRGVVRVELKANQQPGASVAGAVELYGASHALVIGIDAYRAGWPRLSNAVRDAELVAQALEGQGFSVTLERNLNSTALKETFERFFTFKGQDPQARLFVWFAGHGHTLDGEGYLVPADAPSPNDSPDSATQFRYDALSLRRFGVFVRKAKAKHALGIFDACFAGTVFTTQRNLPPAAITRHTTLPVRQFVSSGDAKQEVSDDGRFRKLFIRALNGEAPRADANGDGYLTGSELGMFLSDRVTNLTNARQTPRYGKLRDEDWDRGDFVFVMEHAPVPVAPVGWAKSRSDVPISASSDVPIMGTKESGTVPTSPARKEMGTAPGGAFAHPTRPPMKLPLPTTAQLTVRSNVSGDTVTIDGNPVGPTGPTAHQLAPGEHTIRVEKAGFEPFETTIRLAAGEQETVRARLKKLAPVSIPIPAPDYANWRVLRKIKAHSGDRGGAICRPNCTVFAPDGRTLLTVRIPTHRDRSFQSIVTGDYDAS